MKQRETLTNEQARERIAMELSCHEHARKPQPEDEFHKVRGLSLSSRILRTVVAEFVSCGVNLGQARLITFSLVHEVVKKTMDSQGNSI